MKPVNFVSPFAWLSPSAQRIAFIVLTVLALALTVTFNVLGAPLRTSAAPNGIISFELAGDLPTAQAMVESWAPTGRVYAGLGLGLDYLYMPVYAGAIGLGCVLAAGALARRRPALARLGVLLAWGQLAAALFDALENYALIRVLLGWTQPYWPVVARWCALAKFGLVVAGLAYALLGGLVALSQRRREDKSPV